MAEVVVEMKLMMMMLLLNLPIASVVVAAAVLFYFVPMQLNKQKHSQKAEASEHPFFCSCCTAQN